MLFKKGMSQLCFYLFQVISRCFVFQDTFVQPREGMHGVIHMDWN